MTATRTSIVRGLTVVVTVAFLGVLGYYLVQPGFIWTRLALFAVLGGLAIVGTAGVLYQQQLLVAGSVCGLLLLGFWQAVLWIYIFPVAGVLAVASLVGANRGEPNTPSTG